MVAMVVLVFGVKNLFQKVVLMAVMAVMAEVCI